MKTLLKFFVICTALAAFLWHDTFYPESLRGARVLVTGASTGIGEQLAYHYARLGAQLIITARRESILQKVVDKCLELGAQQAWYISADMSQSADPERVVKYAVEKMEGLDYLVLNHIGSSPFQMWNQDAEHVRTLMQVNFLSYVQMTSAALPTLEKSGGTIIVVSSMLGKLATPFVAPYTATKFAVNGFFETLQHEFSMRKSNVSISIHILGLIDTDSAMEKIKGYINATAYPASEAAMHIIRAGTTRQNFSFYPWYIYFVCLFRDWFIYFRDICIQNSFTY
ncbi:hydroxysteroid 11-beta-dehydrogenase 1-like protein [Denticeps clupeoides]|uniref:hydroxysteroid 11-beta-dehydrogenase 1-like protein n=1 Tax=Denticeps clupeoides TaxID=299321 RepID=UPI0010A491CD|nr:hydroxysteroid 11-beta-dehydrogenase 1-like protein [Denticeps clupeoides]